MRLGRVLRQGMDPSPERRQASAGALVRDLEAALRSAARPPTFASTEPMTPVAEERPAPPPLSRRPRAAPLDDALAAPRACLHRGLACGRRMVCLLDRWRRERQRNRGREASARSQPGWWAIDELGSSRPDHGHSRSSRRGVPSTSASDPGTAGSQLNEEVLVDPTGALRRGDSGAAKGGRVVSRRGYRPQLRSRPLQSRSRSADGRPTPKGDPNPPSNALRFLTRHRPCKRSSTRPALPRAGSG